MKKVAVLAALISIVVSVAYADDHLPADVYPHTGLPADNPILKQGPIRFVANLPVGHGVAAPLGENGSFTRGSHKYLVAASTIYGLHVVDVTNPLAPIAVSDYASAAGCPTQTAEYFAANTNGANTDPSFIGQGTALGLVSGWENDISITPDGRIAILGADAPGRCHDPYMGGLELVDISDVAHPRTLALTRDVGESHSVTIDPKRPWLAYVSTSDNNEFIDIVDFHSCLGGVAKIAACKPVVARAMFDPHYMSGLPLDKKDPRKDLVTAGCHDIRFRGDRAYCAGLWATMILDVSRVLDANGALTGTHLACPLVDAVRAPGVKVTDCSSWTESAFVSRKARGVSLSVVSAIVHDGTQPATKNIQISHQAETIDDGKIMFITDERGGGLGYGPGVDQCVAGRCVQHADMSCPSGGIWFYDIRDERHPKLMKMPDGSPAIFFTKNFVQTNASCTVHYGQQFGQEKLLAFAWYTAGTHLIRFTPDYSKPVATIKFEEVAAYIPMAAWTIQAKALIRNPKNPDEVLIYTADANRGMDVFAVNVKAAK